MTGWRSTLGWMAAAAWLGAAAPLPRPVPDDAACGTAIAASEKGLPPKLLNAIGVTESGRVAGGRVVPWPWTIDVGGAGQFFASKADAVAAVQALQASGVQSIDVGCLQINLLHHPAAFASLDQAFDPAANAGYARRFLLDLFRAAGNWPDAVAAYHSHTPELAADYRRRVMAAWPLAAEYAGASGIGPAPAVSPIYTEEFQRRLAQEVRDLAQLDARFGGELVVDPTKNASVRPARRRPARAAAPG